MRRLMNHQSLAFKRSDLCFWQSGDRDDCFRSSYEMGSGIVRYANVFLPLRRYLRTKRCYYSWPCWQKLLFVSMEIDPLASLMCQNR